MHEEPRSRTRPTAFYAAIVFLAGACYAASPPIIKAAEASGFTWQQTTFAQCLFGLVLFAAAAAGAVARKAPGTRIDLREALRLVTLGLITCSVTLLYTFTLSLVSASMALTLLFQFVWMGIALEAILARRPPKPVELVATVFVLAGAYLGSGLADEGIGALSIVGFVAGVGTAACYTANLFLNGRMGVFTNWAVRGLFVNIGTMIPAFIFCPAFFTSGALAHGIALPGFSLGLVGQLLPIVLLGIATKHLPAGLTTIMASSELPVGILLAVLVLGESATPLKVLGVAFVLAGIAMTQIPELARMRKTPERNAPDKNAIA
ncbi:EamA-like transporter family protein [Slackia sp. CM382]|uniref:DMT family transporter n=1 Tax=Slackia sp. CM382 TaxID=1111137 RepID=UPI00027C496E|nr:DMT family transporter [Slackia sp. CM382]EJU34348.1 EamA-like transporter family protein [Slackia sp. CM382]